MSRTLVATWATLLVCSSVGALARDSGEPNEDIVRAILASGLVNRGVEQAKGELDAIAEFEFDAPTLRVRHARILKQLRAEASATAYAARVAPLLEDAFDKEEARKLADLFEQPLVQRWFETVRKREAKLAEADRSWRLWITKEFFTRFSGGR